MSEAQVVGVEASSASVTAFAGKPASIWSAVGWLVAAAVGVALALTVNGYYVIVLINVALLAIVGVGLNVLLGVTGQISFGHVGFYAIGAYAVGALTLKAGWPFAAAWLLGAAIAGVVGALLALPALRVKGPYLAMVTIAFGFIVEHGAVELSDITGGQNGLMGIPAPELGFAMGERAVAVVAVIVAALAAVAFAKLSRGTWGAAMRAVRDSETAAESIGLNPLVIKTVAFAISAVLAGLAGGLFAPTTVVAPSSFGFIQSILFVLVVMVGGAGSVAGPLIGAVVVGLLPELLATFEEFRLLIFGALLLLVLWVAPSGVSGLALTIWRAVVKKAIADARPHPGGRTEHGLLHVLTARTREPLRAQRLTMIFGGIRAVQNLDLDAPPGQVTSLIGPNGAGKSTVLNMLSGFYQPSAGTVALGDVPLQGLPAMRIARKGVARTYQTSQLFGSLSAEENVSLAATEGRLGAILGSTRLNSAAMRERSRRLLNACGYRGDPATPARDLSHVDRRFVEIARALATDPDVLLLDEPAAGLSREDKAAVGGLLREVAHAGIGVVLVEHDMQLVMSYSDRIVVVDAGQFLASGAPDAIQRDPRVREAYLGESATAASPSRKTRSTRERADSAEVLGIGHLHAGYGAEPVVRDVDLQIREGEVVALLGANGAGKTTLMRALAGLHRPVTGGIHIDGRETNHLPAERIVALGLVLVPEGRQVFPGLTVLDNIKLGAFLKPADIPARLEAVLGRFPPLRRLLHQQAGLLSGGEQQMLAIARGLMAQPRILLLDEPSLGLAPKVIEELFSALDRLRDERMTLLVVDQVAALALSLADRACVIDGGRIVAEGNAEEIRRDAALAEAYLGAKPESRPAAVTT